MHNDIRLTWRATLAKVVGENGKIAWPEVTGVMAGTIAMLVQGGWNPTHADLWRDPAGTWQSIQTETTPVRDAVRLVEDFALQKVWAKAAQVGNGSGLEVGISWDASLPLLRSVRAAGEEAATALLETCLAHAICLPQRVFEAGFCENPLCDQC